MKVAGHSYNLSVVNSLHPAESCNVQLCLQIDLNEDGEA